MPKTKILCTIGPASWDKKVLEKMYESGMTIARINGAYADEAELARVAKIVRGVSDNIALMLDIKGTEVRLNKFAEELHVKEGDEFIIGSSSEHGIYPKTYPDLYKDLSKGDVLQLDDGKVKVKVKSIKNKKIYTKIIYGKIILPGKTINTPLMLLASTTKKSFCS